MERGSETPMKMMSNGPRLARGDVSPGVRIGRPDLRGVDAASPSAAWAVGDTELDRSARVRNPGTYAALIEKRDMRALSFIKEGRRWSDGAIGADAQPKREPAVRRRTRPTANWRRFH